MKIATAEAIVEIKKEVDKHWGICKYSSRLIIPMGIPHKRVIETKNNKHIRAKWEIDGDVVELTPDGELGVCTPSVSDEVISMSLLGTRKMAVTKIYYVDVPSNADWDIDHIIDMLDYHTLTLKDVLYEEVHNSTNDVT